MTETNYEERYAEMCDDPERYRQVLKLLRAGETKEEVDKILVMFLMDMSYHRIDLSNAYKVVRLERGWP